MLNSCLLYTSKTKTDKHKLEIDPSAGSVVQDIFKMKLRGMSQDAIDVYKRQDEAWLDVSDSRNLKGSGMTIAREISHRIK